MNPSLPLDSLLSLPVGPDESPDPLLDEAALELLEPLPPLELEPLPPELLEPLPPLLDEPEPPLLLEPLPPLDEPEPPLDEPEPPLLVECEVVVPLAPVEDDALEVVEVDEVAVDDVALVDDVSLEVDAGGLPLVSSPLHPTRMNNGARIEAVNEGALLKRRVIIFYDSERVAPNILPALPNQQKCLAVTVFSIREHAVSNWSGLSFFLNPARSFQARRLSRRVMWQGCAVRDLGDNQTFVRLSGGREPRCA